MLQRFISASVLAMVLHSGYVLAGDTKELRRPVALAVSDDGQRLLVANRSSGSVSIVDVPNKKVISETTVGRTVADLSWDGKGGTAFIVDEQMHELRVLQVGQDKVTILSCLPVSSYPVNVRTTRDNQAVAITSLWSQRVSFVNAKDPEQLQLQAVVDLPFPPREQCWTPDEKNLIVADAFGGRLAIVDAMAGRLAAVRQITGHNLRGLTWDSEGQNLLIAHQILHADEETTEGGVHWGGVMSNVIRTIPLRWFLESAGPMDEGIYYLGNPERATGDPADLVVTKSRRRIAAYAGLGELGVSDIGANVFDHLQVGKRPHALALSPDEQTVYVANMLDDSISVVHLTAQPTVERISLGGEGRELTVAERGEQLFYDSHLSSDGWFSCHSCHTDGHSNGAMSDTLGDSSFGAPKRVLSLLGVGQTAPWAWNGQVTRLEDQVRKSVELTMRGPQLDDRKVEDLTAFLRTLPQPPSLITARYGDRLAQQAPDLAAAIERGRAVFNEKLCSTCHTPGVYTSSATYDVDLPDERGQREFNPPSLRGVSQRNRLFHDNRSNGLTEVFAKYRHGLDDQLTVRQIEDLVAFLRSL